MDIASVVELIHATRRAVPISTWPKYDMRDIPFAVYDHETVVYINHPAPPSERPRNLIAATSVDINGVETATIPLQFCKDAQTALPIVYHEGFHVFQHHHFTSVEPDMFTAMAYYPDLELDYRVLARLEVEVLRQKDWTADRKLSVLGYLIASRRVQLDRHSSLLPYERFLERNEGTAKYVEQQARQQHFDIAPTAGDVGHGWSRFYDIGAGICWLLDEVAPGWTIRVEQGDSPGDIAVEYAEVVEDLSVLNEVDIRDEEARRLQAFQQEIESDMSTLSGTKSLHIRYPSEGHTMRAFSPTTMVSLGDGRILHRSSFKLLRADGGMVSATVPIIDHVAEHQVILPLTTYSFEDGRLFIHDAGIQVDIKAVAETGEHRFVWQLY